MRNKSNKIGDARNFLSYVHNLCGAFAARKVVEHNRTCYYFEFNGGFTVTTHGDKDNLLMYSVYCKFNYPHPEIKESNQFSGKFNLLTFSSLEFAKIEFTGHFKTMLNLK